MIAINLKFSSIASKNMKNYDELFCSMKNSYYICSVFLMERAAKDTKKLRF